MKQGIIFLILFFLTAAAGMSSAEEIYLKDSTVITGKIIRVTDTIIEYSQVNKPFLIMPRSLVVKIKYDDGLEVLMPDLPAHAGEKPAETIESPAAERPAVQGQEIVPAKEEYRERTGGFIDSYVWLKGCLGFLFVYGSIDNKEENYYKRNRESLITYPAYRDDGPYTSHSEYSIGCELDLMLPAVKSPQKRGFDLTGFKFGIKTSYKISEMEQDLYDESLGDEYINERLLEYQSISIGPELNMVFSPRGDTFNMVVQVYGLGGYIYDGRLSAAPGLRHYGFALTESQYHAEFEGYSVAFGAGNYFVFNKTVPFTVGGAVQYTYSKIDLDRALAVYGNDDSASFDEFGVILSIGVHF